VGYTSYPKRLLHSFKLQLVEEIEQGTSYQSSSKRPNYGIQGDSTVTRLQEILVNFDWNIEPYYAIAKNNLNKKYLS